MIRLYWYPGNASLAPHMLLEEIDPGNRDDLRGVQGEGFPEHRRRFAPARGAVEKLKGELARGFFPGRRRKIRPLHVYRSNRSE